MIGLFSNQGYYENVSLAHNFQKDKEIGMNLIWLGLRATLL